jgi:hypothetical protein
MMSRPPRRLSFRSLALGAWLFAGTLHAQITFNFTYTGTGGFTDPTLGAARQAALNDAGTKLASFFLTSAPRAITLEVDSYSNADSTLASASSALVSSSAGFHRTVVQEKVLTGADTNGGAVDGNISWNWYHAWDITDTIAANAYDFKSTVMHEILQTFGFTSSTGAAGTNTGTAWNTFDNFLTASNGTRLISVGGVFDTGLNSALTGDPGMFFSGANAMAANRGNRVAIFSPTTWSQGSSGAHTDDDTYANTLMISATPAGQGTRVLTAIEVGILQDIGYTMTAIPEPSTYAAILGAAALAVTIIRRRRRTT